MTNEKEETVVSTTEVPSVAVEPVKEEELKFKKYVKPDAKSEGKNKVKEVEVKKGKDKKPEPKKPEAKKPEPKKAEAKAANEGKAVMQMPETVGVMTVPISSLVLSDNWNREEVADPKGIVESIRTQGQLVPILVVPGAKEGTYEISDGRRRYYGLTTLGIKTVDVVLKNQSDAGQSFLMSMATNISREDNTPYEIAFAFQTLVTKYKFTNDQIAKACGKTSGFVSQHLQVFKVQPELQEALKKGKIPLVVVRHFGRISAEEHANFYEKCMTKVIEGTLSASALDEKVTKYLESRAEKASGVKGEKEEPAKRGAAAHKKQKPAKVKDYSELRDQVKVVNKTAIIEHLTAAADKAGNASKDKARTHYLGVICGLELAAGLREKM